MRSGFISATYKHHSIFWQQATLIKL